MGGWEGALAVVGLTVITVVTRSFFFLSRGDWPMPGWLRDGLRHAPLAALAAVVVPEVVGTGAAAGGALLDARVLGAAAGAAWFFWRRGILGTIVAGMAVFLPLRLGLGW
jgi:branched-subunit amino acid transport protein